MRTELRTIFLNELEKMTQGEDKVALFLSGGIDSNAVLIGLKKLGKSVAVYNFKLDGQKPSTDYILAKHNAERFDCDFIEINLYDPVNKGLVISLIRDFHRKKKTDVECLYPFYCCLPHVKERVILTGFESDKYFLLSRKARVHFKDTLELNQQFREMVFDNYSTDQFNTLKKIAASYGKRIESPYCTKSIYDFFYDKDWNELNTPTIKYPLTTMFEETKALGDLYHAGLQMGDSGLREHYEPLLDSSLNKNGRTRMMDLYRDIYNEYHKVA